MGPRADLWLGVVANELDGVHDDGAVRSPAVVALHERGHGVRPECVGETFLNVGGFEESPECLCGGHGFGFEVLDGREGTVSLRREIAFRDGGGTRCHHLEHFFFVQWLGAGKILWTRIWNSRTEVRRWDGDASGHAFAGWILTDG